MRKTIVLIDDEELVREVTGMVLEDNGYSVQVFADGQEALSALTDIHETVAAAIIDFSMPSLNGYEIACKIRERDPAIGIVIISGLEIVPEVRAAIQEGWIVFLSKPFENKDLEKSISKVLVK